MMALVRRKLIVLLAFSASVSTTWSFVINGGLAGGPLCKLLPLGHSRRHHLPPRSSMPRLQAAAFPPSSVLGRAAAFPSLLATRVSPKARAAAVGLAVVVVGVRWFAEQKALRSRRALDATSEWGRFANAPGARTRALLAGLLRVSPSVLRSKLAKTEAAKADLRREAGERLASELIRLGPTYVKIGQIVSCRDNLLPPEYVEALTRLQDRVPAFDGARAAQLAAEAMGCEGAAAANGKNKKKAATGGESGGGGEKVASGEPRRSFSDVFEAFDTTPIAAASLGQVHRATLKPGVVAAARERRSKVKQQGQQQGGEQKEEKEQQQGQAMAEAGSLEVCVKVQREGLRAIYDKDLALLAKMTGAMDKLAQVRWLSGGMQFKWGELLGEATDILYREIDYRAEASNAQRFAECIQDLPWATTPTVYPDLCTEKLLVMEYLPGVKINDVEGLEASGFKRKVLANNLAKAYLYQFCEFGFFNTDPHPGNLAVDNGASGGSNGGASTGSSGSGGGGGGGFFQFGGGSGGKSSSSSSRVQRDGRLIFYDFGQACELTPQQSKGILETIESIVDLDPFACVSAFEKLGVLRPGANQTKLVAMVRKNFASGRVRSKASKGTSKGKPQAASNLSASGGEKQGGLKGEAASAAQQPEQEGLEVGGLEEGVSAAAATAASQEALADFVMPAQLAFVARALAQMEGVGKALDEDFEFVAAAAPVIPELKGGQVYLEEWFSKRVRAWQRLLPAEMRGGVRGKAAGE